MVTYEGITRMGNVDLKGWVIEESPHSWIVTAKKEICVPEKKIILMDRMTEPEPVLLMGTNKIRGGWIV